MVSNFAEYMSIINQWEGVPYLHAGRTKSAGVDCIGAVIGIYEDLGYFAKGEVNYDIYPPDWHEHQDEERLLNRVVVYCNEIQRHELQYADLILMKFGKCFSHGSLYIVDGAVIHGVKNRGVIKSNLNHKYWMKRDKRFFRHKKACV